MVQPFPPISSAGPAVLEWAATLNAFDWALLVFGLVSVARGFLHGALRELFALGAAIAALLVADWYYQPTARWLAVRGVAQGRASEMAAFLLLGVAVFTGVLLLGRLLRRLVHLLGLGFLDRLAGACLGLARAALLSTLLLTALTAFLPPEPWLVQSRLAPPLAHFARELAPLAPAALEQQVRLGVGELLDSWQGRH